MIENKMEKELLDKAEQAKKEEDYSTAIKVYTELIGIKKRPEYLNQLAIAQYNLNQLDQALNNVEKALELDRKFYHAWITKGNILTYQQQYHEAISAYKNAQELKPLEYLPAYCLGIVYQEIQEYNKAEESLQRALDFEKREYLIWLELARVHFRQSHYGRAIRYAKRTLRLKDLSECYIILAVSYYKKDDIKRALRYQKNVVKLLPKNEDALKFLAKIYHEIGEQKKAEEILKKIRQL